MKKKLLSAILATGLFSSAATAQIALNQIILDGYFSKADDLYTGEFYILPGYDVVNGTGLMEMSTQSVYLFNSFDTYLVLWDSNGDMVAYNDDNRIWAKDWDARIFQPYGGFPAGKYYFTLSSAEYVPAGTNIADGYKYIGPKTFGSGPWTEDNAYWLMSIWGHISAVPEPETWAMLLAGLGLMAGVTRRRKANR
ncbi:MAG: DVUA0089 family protein [Proteobacteria bacterium]|nr:DVUA0089 family protein [Pseudomonadota bacterium]